jgi:hypothetical protein
LSSEISYGSGGEEPRSRIDMPEETPLNHKQCRRFKQEIDKKFCKMGF